MTARIMLGEPNEKQKLFLSEKKKYVGFGGARGGGKSWAVRTKAVLLCLNYAGITCLIVRKTYPELRANHIEPLVRLLGCRTGGRAATYNDARKEISFGNGSRIIFRYCDTDRDADRFQGTECDVLFIDEATQQPYERYRRLTACVRGANDFPKRIYLTANPGGEGHEWFKRLFVDRRYEDGEDSDDYVFIKSLVTDNKALMDSDPDYVRQLEALPAKLRKAWLDGDWNIFDGAFFEEFADKPEGYRTRQWSHVIDPFDVPDDWKIYRSFDWGYAKPFSCAWWAVDPDGVLYRILELYGCTKNPNEGLKRTPEQVFSEIHRIECEHPWLTGKNVIGVADPAIWDAETGESIAAVAARHGVYFSKGDHKRIPGWMQVHYRLAFDENGYAMMYVFKNCKGFIRTVPLLQYDASKPEDLDTDGEDHIADEVRYMCMARPIRPRMKPVPASESDPLALCLGISRADLAPPPRAKKIEIIK